MFLPRPARCHHGCELFQCYKRGNHFGWFLNGKIRQCWALQRKHRKKEKKNCKSTTKQARGRKHPTFPTDPCGIPSVTIVFQIPHHASTMDRGSFLTLFALRGTDAALSCWIKHAKQCFHIILCKYAWPQYFRLLFFLEQLQLFNEKTSRVWWFVVHEQCAQFLKQIQHSFGLQICAGFLTGVGKRHFSQKKELEIAVTADKFAGNTIW